MRRIAAVLLVVAIAGCGKSPEDKAYDNGKDVGKAVRELRDASSFDAAKSAVQDLRDAAGSIGEDARKAIRDQVDTQTSTLSKAATGDISGLKTAIDDVRAQSEAFQHSNNSVANSFWSGFEDGYDG